MLQYLTTQTHDDVDACVIWLHGLGADGDDFYGVVPNLDLPDELRVRFIFPHAPVRAITLNQGMRMRAWYDIVTLDRSAEPDRAGILQSVSAVMQLINEQIKRGIRAERVVVAGFSQGGAVALMTGLLESIPSIIALSTYLPWLPDIERVPGLHVFQAHGRDDQVIPVAWGQAAQTHLQKRVEQLEWHEYAMPHSVCLEELQDIGHWLTHRLAK